MSLARTRAAVRFSVATGAGYPAGPKLQPEAGRSGRDESAPQLGERRLAVLEHRDRALDPGYLQQPPHLVVVRAEHESPFPLAVCVAVEALPGAHDQRDPGRVDELALAEVEDDFRSRLGKRPLELLLQLGRGIHVELAAHCEGADAVLELLAVDLVRNRAHGADPTSARPTFSTLGWVVVVPWGGGVAKEIPRSMTMLVPAGGRRS